MAQRTVSGDARDHAARPSVRWHVLPDAQAVRDQAVKAILEAAAQAIAMRGIFHLVLAGGTTPREVYAALRDARAEWAGWQVWFGDERCLPPTHPERNSRLAKDVWLDHVAIPVAQVHDIPAEAGPEEGARVYADMLEEVGQFDLVLLGLGEDGHTASLFPGHLWGVEAGAPAALAIHDAPKAPPERVSLSARRLAATRRLIFVVTGAGKRDAVCRWRAGEVLPAAAVRPEQGGEVLVEEAAVRAA